MIRNTDGWIQIYKEKGALWIHDGNPKRPHALFTFGMHSDSCFNSKLAISDDDGLRRQAAADLVALVEQSGLFEQCDRIVGPATGATKLAEEMALAKHSFWASPEKKGEGSDRAMVFTATHVLPGEKVLLIEDVITTGGSLLLTEEAVIKAGGIPMQCVAAIVNRGGLNDINGKKIVSLIDSPMPMWSADECPLCRKGSEAIRPKDPENWKRLIREYH